MIFKRVTCRKFKKIPIEDSKILQIIEAGIAAPSASNSQNIRFLIIKDVDNIEKLAKYKTPNILVRSAIVIIVVFVDTTIHKFKQEERYIWEETWVNNASAAIQNMLLQATKLKIGSCWIALSSHMDGTRLLGKKTNQDLFLTVPQFYSPKGLILLGYPEQVDKEGYPLGDKMHANKPTKRKDVGEYLI